ncbi:MAG: helix-turn-helix domain-containing protein [Chloroflexi bacterium]|nr:helix-turn-helix domain-containing protein [Chloroflexota bacterium]
MTRRQKDPLRPLTQEETTQLERISRATSAPSALVARAKAILAVADGHSFSSAAQLAGRRSGDAVAHLVARFNTQGLGAVQPEHGGGPKPTYTRTERGLILAEVQRAPDREVDKTATWSLTTLQRALRQAPNGLPNISTYTIWCVLHDEGWSWQEGRSWCPTGIAIRKRQGQRVPVVDPDTEPKKVD